MSPATDTRESKRKGKSGRPREPNAKRITLTLRASEDELDVMQRAADLDRRPLAQWMRDRLLIVAKKEIGKS